MMNKQGYLELIIGPMYAGKSTELIRIINRYKCLNKNIVIINHTFNNRYGSVGLTTHNKQNVDNCVILSMLKDLELQKNIILKYMTCLWLNMMKLIFLIFSGSQNLKK